MLWWIDAKKVHQLLCLDIIILNKSLNTITIFFGTHMLMSREICDNVKTFLITENAFKNWICKVQCIAAELCRNVKSFG